MRMTRQSGIMLIEALIGLLLFSIGIIALMGLQANALATMGESKYRASASFVADSLIADMQADAAYVAAYNRVNPTRLDFPFANSNNSPYVMDSSSAVRSDPDNGKPPTPSTTAGVLMKGLSATTAMQTLAANQARSAYKFQHAALDLPGGKAPTVEIIVCKKSDPAPDARCPSVVDSSSPLNIEDYGAIVHITMEWRMPNAPVDSKFRKHETWAYILAENFQ